MPAVSQVIQNTDTELRLTWLPVDSETPTEYTFTSDGITASGATTIALDPVSPVALEAGDKLTFGSVEVTLTADAASGASSLTVAATSDAIPDDTSATTKALRRVRGANTASPSSQTEDIDVSGFEDGVDYQMLNVAITRNISVSGITTEGLFRSEILAPAQYNSAFVQRQAYFELEFGDGSMVEGVCRLTNVSEETQLRNVLRYSVTLMGQGSWTYTPAP